MKNTHLAIKELLETGDWGAGMNLSRSLHSFTSFSSKENKIHWGPDRKSEKRQLKYDQSMTVLKSRSIPQENYFSGTSSDLQEEKVGELRASDYSDFLK